MHVSNQMLRNNILGGVVGAMLVEIFNLSEWIIQKKNYFVKYFFGFFALTLNSNYEPAVCNGHRIMIPYYLMKLKPSLHASSDHERSLVRPVRIERTTYGLEVRCSILLSYGRVILPQNIKK